MVRVTQLAGVEQEFKSVFLSAKIVLFLLCNVGVIYTQVSSSSIILISDLEKLLASGRIKP